MAYANGLFDVDSLNSSQIKDFFLKVREFKNNKIETKYNNKVVALLFLEPSTRTKLSFEMAVHRLGARSIYLDSTSESSLKKGESIADTFWTLHAMRPDVFVIRSGDDFPLKKLASESCIPIVNAGYSSISHPTQALLDAYTLFEKFGTQKLKILFLGDVAFSRVAKSNFKIFKTLGYEIGFCSPNYLEINDKELFEGKNFTQLNEALKWCDVCIGLRTQWERSKSIDVENLKKNYQLNKSNLSLLKNEAVIMHPGPTLWGQEFSEDVLSFKNLLIREQVTNGVYVRSALLDSIWSNK